MPSIYGRMEWEDGDLRPADRAGGGLLDNLVDSGNRLQGRATFYPEGSSKTGPAGGRSMVQSAKDWARDEGASLAWAFTQGLIIELGPILVDKWRSGWRPPPVRYLKRKLGRSPVPEPSAVEASCDPEVLPAVPESPEQMPLDEAMLRTFIAALLQEAATNQRARVARAEIIDPATGEPVDLRQAILSMAPAQLESARAYIETHAQISDEFIASLLAGNPARLEAREPHPLPPAGAGQQAVPPDKAQATSAGTKPPAT